MNTSSTSVASDASSVAPQPAWHGQAYSTKRFGISITDCDSEPVQTPGCVQAHGALLVLRAADLTIAQVSENSAAVLGTAPAALLGRPLQELVGPGNAARLQVMLQQSVQQAVQQGVKQGAQAPDIERNPSYVFTHTALHTGLALDASVHTVEGVVVLEFEATGRGDSEQRDFYALIRRSVAQLQRATTLSALGDIACAEVRALTGLDRVMVYRFHDDGHGEVFCESRRDDLPSWLGLHYPAQDIPEPAREVFRQTWIRPLRDVDGGLAELLPLTHPDSGRPLRMTHCALRAPSVMYTEYLRNMRVTASLTLSIRRDDKLWGLIAGHHYSGPFDMPYDLRAACELLAQIVSLQHAAAEEREHAAYRQRIDSVQQQLVTQAAHEGGLAALLDGPPTLLDGLDTGGTALYHRDRWWCAGSTPSEKELDALGDWLTARPEMQLRDRPLFATDQLSVHYPPGQAFASVASGLLAIALSRSAKNLVLWFRPETTQTVRWGGNPHDKPTVVGPHGARLTPRASFELFIESVRGRSKPWLAVELEAAMRFRMLMMELIVARADQLAGLNADLARSNDELDAFAYVASHDLKEPLRGIHKYAHQLAENAGQLGEADLQRLAGLTRLTLRMDTLLDSLLHFSRVGRAELLLEDCDVGEVVEEALDMVAARRGDKPTHIEVPRPLPHVRADRVRLREIYTNLLSNALKYNQQASTNIEIGWLAPHEVATRHAYTANTAQAKTRGWPAAASAQTVLYVRDNGIGIEPRHIDQVFKMFRRLHGRDDYGGGTGAGLTIVRKLVERGGGEVWIESAPGQGSCFYFFLPAEDKPLSPPQAENTP